MSNWGIFEYTRQRAQELKQQRQPPPIKTVLAPGSMEWLAEQEKARSNAAPAPRLILRRVSTGTALGLSSPQRWDREMLWDGRRGNGNFKTGFAQFEAGTRDATGKRKIYRETFRGARDGAERRLTQLLAQYDTGTYVCPVRSALPNIYAPGWQALTIWPRRRPSDTPKSSSSR